MSARPVGECPPLGPPAMYWCEDCAERWRKYGAQSGCDRHSGAQIVVTVEFSGVDADRLLCSQHPEWQSGARPRMARGGWHR